MPNIKKKIKKTISHFQLGRKILECYGWLRDPEYMRLLRKTNVGFHNSGKEALYKLVDIFEANNVNYWLTFGTLLGAVRQHDFIGHDGDIDVAIFEHEYSEKLLSEILATGFSLYRRIDIYSKSGDVNGFELSFMYNNCQVDVFIFHPYSKDNSEKIYTFDFVGNIIEHGVTIMFKQPRKLILPWKGLTTIEMCGRQMNIPENFEEYLTVHYGKDYMIPNPSWSNLQLTNIEIVPDSIGVVTNGITPS